jgi:PST family polysaccharide transporter
MLPDSKERSELKINAVQGVKWSAISQGGRQVSQWITIAVLARILSPSDFGLVGMAMVVIGFMNIFRDMGTSPAIIQRQVLSENLLSSIFWVNLIIGILSMSIVFLGAPLGGLLYHDSQVIPVLQILSISFFISAFSLVHQALLERSLSFNTLAKVEIIASVCGSVVGISLALSGKGVWSLVFQSITTILLTSVLLWIANPWRPKWVLHWQDIKSVYNFSLNLTGFGVFNYFARNADYLLIGRYLGAQDLGYYTLAYKILLFPIQNLSAVISRVAFPAMASIQNDNQRISNAYLRINNAIAMISFPLMLGVMALADPFVTTVFGERWRPMIILIQILAPVGLMQSIISPVGQIYLSKGRADLMFQLGAVTGLLTVLSFIIGLQWDVVGVSVAYAVITFALSYVEFYVPLRLIDLKVSKLGKVCARPFANSLIMFIFLLVLINTMHHWASNAVVLIVAILLGVGIYSLLSWKAISILLSRIGKVVV